jgi:Ca-activated chloride channel family protein
VDTASYSNVRRFLRDKQKPPADAVRIEELINYFSYDYPQPDNNEPFSVTAEVAGCPWNPEHRLVHIGLQGRRLEDRQLPPRNLVFLLDVSGSMGTPRKLPLLKAGMRLLTEQLTERARVDMVVYAGASGLVLPSTSGSEKNKILSALSRLEAGGSTNGGAGIMLAYRTARANFDPQGINRVILATDGDFNVGISSPGALTRLIEEQRKSGVFLTVLGLGTGNLKDSTMEQLADRGNGNYAYIDTLAEARKVLVREAGATLITIAKDVKIQVEFNPARVQAYRLIGYENRLLRAEDFNDDTKDAGEIGAGHTVSALYEIVPSGKQPDSPKVDALKYQSSRKLSPAADRDEVMTLKLRYKEPNGSKSKLLVGTVQDRGDEYRAASDNFRFSAAVAGFGMLLRDSKYKGATTFALITDLARDARGPDPHGYRAEFIELVKLAGD